MTTQIDQLKRSLLDLNGAIDTQRADNAKLRGSIEQLARDRRRGADESKPTWCRASTSGSARSSRRQVTVDDKEFSVDPEEKRSYDDALAGFRKGEFDRAATGFAGSC